MPYPTKFQKSYPDPESKPIFERAPPTGPMLKGITYMVRPAIQPGNSSYRCSIIFSFRHILLNPNHNGVKFLSTFFKNYFQGCLPCKITVKIGLYFLDIRYLDPGVEVLRRQPVAQLAAAVLCHRHGRDLLLQTVTCVSAFQESEAPNMNLLVFHLTQESQGF